MVDVTIETRTAPSSPPNTSNIDFRSAAAVVIAVVVWASAFVAIRDAGPALSSAPMALLRLAVAALALTVLVGLRGGVRLPRARTPWLLVIGYAVLWLAGYTVALNAAERHVDAGTAALLVNLAPLLVALGAAALLREKLSRALVVGMSVALAGVTTIAFGTAGRHDMLGVTLCLLSAVLYAAGVLVQKAALRHVDALTAIWLGCLIATVVLLPWTPQLITELSSAPARTIADGVYLGLFPTAIGFTAWSYALRRTDAARLTTTSYAIPAVSVLLSWLLLAEAPTPWALAGGAVCLLGVAISRRRS